ncbi:hypothetical protein BDF14DRAFT_1980258, partial [Spinellus fusiger]
MSHVTSGQTAMPAFRRDPEKTEGHRFSFLGLTVQQVKAELSRQIEEHDQTISTINLHGISRSTLLKQASELKQSLQELDKMDDQKALSPASVKRLESLANDFYAVKTGIRPSAFDTDVTRLLPSAPVHTSPSKQRSKTTAQGRKHADIEFATEIGQGLLNEVRKLQSALQEKEEIIKQLEITKGEMERSHEVIAKRLKQHDNSKERLKDENWDLEVANEELKVALKDLQQSTARVNADHVRITKQLAASTEQIEHLKAQEEKSKVATDLLKSRQEQDILSFRRNASASQREQASLKKQLEAVNTELKICQAKLAIKVSANNRTPVSEELPMLVSEKEKEESDKTLSPNPPARNQALESETMKQSLTHAHRILSNLRSTLHKEKLEKFELKKMLADSQENIEQMRKDMNDWTAANQTRKVHSGRKKQVKRRGARQPKGFSTSPNRSEENSENEENSDEGDWEDHGHHFNELEGLGTMQSLSFELENKKPAVESRDAAVNTDTLPAGGLQYTTFDPSATLHSQLLMSANGFLTPSHTPQNGERLSFDIKDARSTDALMQGESMQAIDIAPEIISGKRIVNEETASVDTHTAYVTLAAERESKVLQPVPIYQITKQEGIFNDLLTETVQVKVDNDSSEGIFISVPIPALQRSSAPETISKAVSETAPNNVSEIAPETISNVVSNIVLETAPKTVSDTTTEAVSEIIPKNASETVSKNVPDTVSETVSE